jgi:hypothetical protein
VSNSARPTLPDLTAMQESINAYNQRLAAAYSIPFKFIAGSDEVPLADQEIPAEGTE